MSDTLEERMLELANLLENNDGGYLDRDLVGAMLRDLVQGTAVESIADSLGLYEDEPDDLNDTNDFESTP
jgi:hypothetical protein